MLAEAIHSVADAGNQALLLLGVRRSAKRPSAEHPFGYGRERYFWSFIVAVALFTLGAGFAVYEGIDKVRHPHEIKGLWTAVAILGLGIVLEGLSFRTAIREARPLRGGLTCGGSSVAAGRRNFRGSAGRPRRPGGPGGGVAGRGAVARHRQRRLGRDRHAVHRGCSSG